MSMPESHTQHTSDKTNYKAMLEQIAVEDAEAKQVEEEERERKEREKTVQEAKIAELRWKKAEQEEQQKKAEEEKLAREEAEKKEEERREKEQRKREVVEVEKRRKQVRGGEDKDGDVAMGELEDRGQIKWMKSGELEKRGVGSGKQKGKGRPALPSTSRMEGSSRTQENRAYIPITPIWKIYYDYLATYNDPSDSEYVPLDDERIEEEEEDRDSDKEGPKQAKKKHTWGTKGLDGRKMKMGGKNMCSACVQAQEECEEELGRNKITCKHCMITRKKCVLATSNDMLGILVMHGRTEYQVEKLALLQRGIEEMCEMREEMTRMWRLMERIAPEEKVDEVDDEVDDEADDEADDEVDDEADDEADDEENGGEEEKSAEKE